MNLKVAATVAARVDASEALATIAGMERRLRWFAVVDKVLLPLSFGINAWGATDSLLWREGWQQWLALVQITVCVFVWHLAQKSMERQAEAAEHFDQLRRKVHWLTKLLEGELHRLVHSEEGQEHMTKFRGMARLPTFCARHAEEFTRASADGHAASHRMTELFMHKFLGDKRPNNQEEFGRYLGEFEKAGTAMCCYLGDDTMGAVLKAAPRGGIPASTDMHMTLGMGEPPSMEGGGEVEPTKH